MNIAEVRCRKCNRLLGKGIPGNFEVKCPRCGTINVFLNNKQIIELHERAKIDTMEDRHVG